MSTLRGRVEQRVHDLVVDATMGRLREPSFTYKMLELTRMRRRLRELDVTEPVFTVNAKDDAHDWAVKLGVRTPQLIATYDRPSDIAWSDLPDRVVVKPVRGSTSNGVHLLRRDAAEWVDVHTGAPTSSGAVVSTLDGLAADDVISAAVLVEELVDDPRRPGMPPVDYKIMTFFGQVGLIEAKITGPDVAGGHGAWRSFDPAWTPIPSPYRDPEDTRIAAPVHGAALLELARQISAAVPRPFLRVDLYEDAQGPVFGEITPEPGGSSRMHRDMDRTLGQLWEDAETRLKLRAVVTGQLDPAAEALPEAFAELH